MDFVAFACLSGDERKQSLRLPSGCSDLLLKPAQVAAIDRFQSCSRERGGGDTDFCLIVDDFGPTRIWRWDIEQTFVTDWCRSVIQLAQKKRRSWQFRLASEFLEVGSYEEVLLEISKPKHALLVSRYLQYLRESQPERLGAGKREVAARKVANFVFHGLALEKVAPGATLIQTEAPRVLKDPLYSVLRRRPLSIVHLWPEERR